TECRAELDKLGMNTSVAGGMQPQPLPGGMGGTGEPPLSPGTARIGSDPKSPDSVATQADALRKVQFQKLRSDGLKIVADASAAFGRGETDLAIQMLVDYTNRVRSANLEASNVALLLRPINSRLEMFRVMKGQTD